MAIRECGPRHAVLALPIDMKSLVQLIDGVATMPNATVYPAGHLDCPRDAPEPVV